VVKNIQDTNGRFLHKTSEGWWKVTSDKVAREKTCSAFRSKIGKAAGNGIKELETPEDGDPSAKRNPKRARYDPSVVKPAAV
jgi:hypothetical protein